MTTKFRHNIFSDFASLLPLFKPYRTEIIKSIFALLLTAGIILFFGRAVKYLIDYGFVAGNIFSLTLWMLVFIGSAIAMAIAGYYRSSIINSVAEKIIGDLRKKIYDNLIKNSLQFFKDSKTGDIMSRFTLDCANLHELIANFLPFFIRNCIVFFGGFCFLFLTSAKLTIISINLAVLVLVPLIFLGKKIRKLSAMAQNNLSAINSCVEETISGIKTIKAYCQEEKKRKNFAGFVQLALDDLLTKIKVRSLLVAVVIALSFSSIAFVIFIGGKDVLSSKISAGDLFAFVFYFVILATSLSAIGQSFSQIHTGFVSFERICELLKTDFIDCLQSKNIEVKKFPSNEISIEFNNVNFSYTGENGLILRDINLKIKPYEKLAIVGSSGSGKSTILELLLRFYDINFGGEIKINNCNIKSFDIFDLRKNFSYVAQDNFVFSGTILENIAYFDEQISVKKIEQFIEQNNFLHFIKKLPQGIHSFVGEKGSKLSLGERQRIAIARAIIKDAPIFLFDEATSALDFENEREIMFLIKNLMREKTVIFVSHKIAILDNFDRVMRVENGKML